MRCFDYPFDPAFILQKKRALRRELLASEGLVPKKVAILSGSTVGEIKNILVLEAEQIADLQSRGGTSTISPW